MFENINEVSVIVSAVLAVAVGNIWYSSMLFGKHWRASLGSSLQPMDDNDTDITKAVTKALLTHTVVFFVLAHLIVLSREASSVSLFGFISLLLIFLWGHLLTPVIWEKRPFSYVLIHAGYFTLVIFIGVGVITKWPW